MNKILLTTLNILALVCIFLTLGAFNIKLFYPLFKWYKSLLVSPEQGLLAFQVILVELLLLFHLISIYFFRRIFQSVLLKVLIVIDILLTIFAMGFLLVSYIMDHAYDDSTFNFS